MIDRKSLPATAERSSGWIDALTDARKKPANRRAFALRAAGIARRQPFGRLQGLYITPL
jgi:hypothetical protein